MTEANGAVTSYTYDAAGNKIAQTDANNHTWTYQYDALNRLVKELDPLQRATTYAFDAIGNLKTKTDAKGQVTTYTYNVRRLTNVAYAGGADTFTYDQLGRRSGASNGNAAYTYTYDTLNRLTSSHRQSSSFTLSYTYDANGNRNALGTGGPDSEVRGASYLYDAKNRLTKISDATFGDFTFQYDAMDRRTELHYPNGMTTNYTYDNAYRLTAMVSKNLQGLVIDAWRYTYDSAGNRLSKTDLDGKVETYGYDSVYRLTDAHYGDGSTEQFTYDAAGNRLSESQNGAQPLVYSYDVANEMLKKGNVSFTYDANGNAATQTDPATTRTTSYQYDGKNELTHVDQSYTGIFEDSRYNPDRSRVFFTNNEMGGGIKNVQYDPAGNPVLDEYLNSRSDVYRLYGPGVDEPLGEYFRGYGRATYLLHDALGSVTAITNKEGTVETRQTYRAFGQMTRTGPGQDVTGHPPSRLAFTSRENSVLGLMQYRSRYYSPDTGRFLQNDSYRGSDLTPPSLHRYTYVFNNPVRYGDPRGMAADQSFDLVQFAFSILNYFSRGVSAAVGAIGSLIGEMLPVSLLGVKLEIEILFEELAGIAAAISLYDFALVVINSYSILTNPNATDDEVIAALGVLFSMLVFTLLIVAMIFSEVGAVVGVILGLIFFSLIELMQRQVLEPILERIGPAENDEPELDFFEVIL